jgi:hypothetical protein
VRSFILFAAILSLFSVANAGEWISESGFDPMTDKPYKEVFVVGRYIENAPLPDMTLLPIHGFKCEADQITRYLDFRYPVDQDEGGPRSIFDPASYIKVLKRKDSGPAVEEKWVVSLKNSRITGNFTVSDTDNTYIDLGDRLRVKVALINNGYAVAEFDVSGSVEAIGNACADFFKAVEAKPKTDAAR